MVREQTKGDPERLGRVLDGLRAYQESPRNAAQHELPCCAAKLGATLRDYGGEGLPVLFVPSLINPPNVLDLSPEKSILRWLSKCGYRVLLLDWGWDVEQRRKLSVAGHVEEIILPFLQEIGTPASLVGYCLGGTMAVAAAASAKVNSVATIAAPWHFSGFSQQARDTLGTLWSASEKAVDTMGLLPMEVLQSAFWSLDPARTVAKFERFAALPPGSDEARAFVQLEDWANDGPPIGEGAARELFESFFERDDPGAGRWSVAGVTVDPARLSCPLFNIISTTDRIVPSAASIGSGERLELPQGHVGMIVGSDAKTALWEPLAAWLSRVSATC